VGYSCRPFSRSRKLLTSGPRGTRLPFRSSQLLGGIAIQHSTSHLRKKVSATCVQRICCRLQHSATDHLINRDSAIADEMAAFAMPAGPVSGGLHVYQGCGAMYQ